MGSLNSKQLQIARSICYNRDGPICQGCNKTFADLEVTTPDVNHIDGNENNNPSNGSNWNLMCHSCNVKDAWVRKRMNAIDNSNKDVPFTYSVSSKMELQWIKWMIDYIRQHGKISWSRSLNTGALEIDGSQETVKRYLKKHLDDPENPKSIFKVWMDGNYDTWIKFTDHVQEYFDGQ